MPKAPLSPRLAAIVDALPLRPGLRVLEIGCGPGAAARAIVERMGDGFVLATDRSAKAIAQTTSASQDEIAAGKMQVRQVAAEDLVLEEGESPYDIVLAVRVGAFDGRHPAVGERALKRVAAALAPDGQFFIDGGNPLQEITLERE